MGIVLDSEKVILRETIFDDLELYSNWETQDFIREFLTISDDRCYEDIVREYYGRLKDDSCMDFTIIDKVNDVPVGRLYISRIDYSNDSCDLTRIYIGKEDAQSKGFGKSAILLLLEYLFEEKNLNRVTLDFFDGNFRAAGLYESIGFIHEGKMRECGKKNGWYYNLNLMSILRSEYWGIG